ncbi:MAG TPA: hypothetical protein GXX36_05780 [Clostridiaceae bacterium]|nr:hypothetical protein [Clostridiaceae bacterium]HHV99069.1 hypothetical protein [Clostridiaceae bacterium]
MSIKPIDFQISVPRTLEISKTSSAEMQKNAAIQQQQTIQTQHNTEKVLKQVYARDKAENIAIREKQSDGKRRDDGRQKGEKSKKENNENDNGQYMRRSLQSSQISTIDIKL